MRWMDQKDPLDPSGEISSGYGEITYVPGRKQKAVRDYFFNILGLMIFCYLSCF